MGAAPRPGRSPAMTGVNTEIMKYAVLIGAAPLWIRYFKALWKELNDSLAEEGGLLGVPPRPDQLRRIREELKDREDGLVSDPRDRPGNARGAGRAGSPSRQGRGAAGGGAPIPQRQGVRKTGFDARRGGRQSRGFR